MKSSKSNAIVYAIGMLTVALFSYLFYLDVNKRIEVGEAKIIGTVTFKKRVAQRRYSRQVVWEDLEMTEPIYNNDTIRTGDKSEAVVKIFDGTEFTLNENSMVLLSLGGEGLDLEFSQGSLTARRDDLSGKPLSNVRIKSGDTAVVFGKSTINISKDKSDNLNLVVDKGTAVVQTAGGEKVVGEEEKAIVSLKAASVTIEKQKIILISPASGSVFSAKDAEKAITFNWKQLPEPGMYFVDIEQTDVPKANKITKKVEGEALQLAVVPGSYKWMVRYRSHDGIKEEVSETRTFIVLPHDSVIPISPAEGAVYYYRNNPPLIIFKWEPTPSAVNYMLSIFKDAKLTAKVTEFNIQTNSISIDVLTEGTWFWKIDAYSGIAGVGAVGSSEVRKLVVVKRPIVPPPELLLPPPGIRFWQKVITKKPILFSWRNDPEIIESEIVIAHDSEFKKIFHYEKRKTSSFALERDIPKGSYFWKVRGIIDESLTTDHSPTWNFSVTEDVMIELVSPADRQIIIPKDEEEAIKVRFSWKKMEFDGMFTLQLAQDKEFKKIVTQKTEKNYMIEVPELQRGEYFWRVILTDENGAELVKSAARSFIVEEKLRAPIAISPANNSIVDMWGKKSLSFRWQPVVGADLYTLELFMVKDGREYRILNRNTKVPYYEMDELFRLDEAKFLWTIRAHDIEEGKVMRTSPVSRYYFDIVLSKKMNKPVLRVPKIILAE